MDHNPSSRRPHYHRGRRGTDRRGGERRTPPQAADPGPRPAGDQVDVDQIMREIRSRVSQRHGIDLTPQQIQELAARRLEAVLDPRSLNPTLFDQLRKSASSAPEPTVPAGEGELGITEDAIYEGSGAVRFFRRLLNPLLKLLFNPAPLIAALQTQSRLNREAAARAAERERRQTEWNALHYQVLQRLVTEVSRNSLEVQALILRVEALAGRVDFNDRRVRTLESAPAPARNQRPHEVPPQPAPAPPESGAGESAPSQAASGGSQSAQPDGQRRRRRRRRGRRGAMAGAETGAGAAVATGLAPDNGADEEDDEIQDGAEPFDPAQADAPNASPSVESTQDSTVVNEPDADVREAPPIALLEPPVSAGPTPTEVAPEPAPAAWPSPGPAPNPLPEPAQTSQAGAPPMGSSEPQEPR